MPEAINSEIKAEQGKIQKQKEGPESPAKLKEKLSQSEYQQIFFQEVDKEQNNLQKLSDDLHDTAVTAFIDQAQNKVLEKLRGIAESGQKIIEYHQIHENYDRRVSGLLTIIGGLAEDLRNELKNITSEAAHFELINSAQRSEADAEAFEQRSLAGQADKPLEQQISIGQEIVQHYQTARDALSSDARTSTTSTVYDQTENLINNKIDEATQQLNKLKLRQNPAEYLKELRQQIQEKLGKRIQNGDLLAKTMQNFDEIIKPDSAKLSSVDRNNSIALEQTFNGVEAHIKDFLDHAPFDFIKSSINGRNFECHYIPPKTGEEYASSKAKVNETMNSYSHYVDQLLNIGGRHTETSMEFTNGVLQIHCAYKTTDPEAIQLGIYKEVSVSSNEIFETRSSEAVDKKQLNFQDFEKSFSAWKKNASAESFTYGTPTKTFNIRDYLQKQNIKPEDLTISMMKNNPPPEFEEFKKWPGGFSTQTYELANDNGKTYVKSNTFLNISIAHAKQAFGSKIEFDAQGNALKETEHEYQKINEEMRHTVTITEFYPTKKGEERGKEKKREIFKDGVIISSSAFNENGELVRRETAVEGCPGVLTVEYSGGKPIRDADGKPTADVYPSMEFTDKDNKKVSIKPFSVAKKEDPNLSEDQYFDFLARTLNSDQLLHAYINSMMHYSMEYETGGDYWQTPSEMLGHEQNGRPSGDCDDYAMFMENILRRQGKNAYAIYMAGHKEGKDNAHAETIVLEVDAEGKYHAKSYGTFGVDIDGNRIGVSLYAAKVLGYDTAVEALASLVPKWRESLGMDIFTQNGNLMLMEIAANEKEARNQVNGKMDASVIRLVSWTSKELSIKTVRHREWTAGKNFTFYVNPRELRVNHSSI
jgi:hypothetical protein